MAYLKITYVCPFIQAELTKQQNDFKIMLKKLEDDLLSRLSSAGENILGDTALVENLETTKSTASEIEQKVCGVMKCFQKLLKTFFFFFQRLLRQRLLQKKSIKLVNTIDQQRLEPVFCISYSMS